MAFTRPAKVFNNAKQKALDAYIKSITPQAAVGEPPIPVPTALQFLEQKDNELESLVVEHVKRINAERRAAALATANPTQIAAINTALGIVDYEDTVPANP